MDLELANRAVLVTGGSGGIGAAIARRFASEGARVAVTYHSDAGAADGVVADLGADAFAVPMDLADLASVRAAVDAAVERFGGLDVVVNSAVRWEEWRERIEEWEPAEWEPVLRANLDGVFALVQRAAPALRASSAGRVVLVSSSLVERGMVGCWSYATAKAGGHGLARGLAWDLGRDGVLVNTVMPGMVLVDGHHRSAPDDELGALAATQPAGRLPTAEDVANAVAFLGSAANGCITGEVLPVTGGTP